MYGAYKRLSSQWIARNTDLRAIHNLDLSHIRRRAEEPMTDAQRHEVPPLDHPILRTHPETGRKCVYLGDHGEIIVGMGYNEGRQLIDEFNDLIMHLDLTYQHRWSAGQLILWDNRGLLPTATSYDALRERRVIRFCTVLDEVPH